MDLYDTGTLRCGELLIAKDLDGPNDYAPGDDHIVRQPNFIGDSVFDRLPTEILTYIFMSYVSKLFRARTPFTLGAVCHRWRQIVWMTPRIWTRFELNVRGKRISAARVQLAEEWLSRAGTHALSIKLYSQDVKDSGPDTARLYRLIDIFNSYANRWYFLYLHAPPSVIARLNDSAASESQCLHKLVFKSWRVDWPIGSLNHVTPRIVRLQFESLNPLSLNWSHVTQLTARLFKIKEAIQIIKLSPCLRQCDIQISQDWERDPSQNSDPRFVHPVIKHLKVKGSSTSIFNYLSLPALAYLSVAQVSEYLLDDFLSFLEDSSSHLKTLVMENILWDGEDQINIVRAVPSLEVLSISTTGGYGIDCEPFYGALATPSTGDDVLLPALRELKLEPNEIFPWHVLLQILDRSSQDSGHRRPLESVEIISHYQSISQPIPYISKEILSQLSNFTDRVRFKFKFPSEDARGGYEDLWKLSMERDTPDDEQL